MIRYSIIIPISKSEPLFQQTLDEIYGQNLKGIHKDQIEVIIVQNNGYIVQFDKSNYSEIKIKVFTTQRLGPGLARNFGAENATGEFLIFLDSDCIPDKDWLSKYHEKLMFSNAACIAGHVLQYEEDWDSFTTAFRKNIIQPLKELSLSSNSLFFIFDSANFLIKKEVFLKNQFSSELRFEDQIFYNELRQNGDSKIVIVADIFVYKVINESIYSLLKNIFISYKVFVNYNLKVNRENFLKENSKATLGLVKSLFSSKSNNLLRKFLIFIYCSFGFIFSSSSFLVKDLKKTAFQIVFFIGSLFIFTMYLPYSAPKSYITSKISSIAMLNISFWEIYSGDGTYFSDVFYRCKNEPWVNYIEKKGAILKKSKRDREYKEIILARSFAYLAPMKEKDIQRKIFSLIKRECSAPHDLVQLKIHYKNINPSGRLSTTRVEVYHE